jgi:hypothetical protein
MASFTIDNHHLETVILYNIVVFFNAVMLRLCSSKMRVLAVEKLITLPFASRPVSFNMSFMPLTGDTFLCTLLRMILLECIYEAISFVTLVIDCRLSTAEWRC